MTSITERIQSIRDMVGGDARKYIRPDPKRLEEYQKALYESEEAQSYLKIERGLADETVKYFSLGYDKERHAIVIPVFKNNELVNLRYRIINPQDKQAKYIQERDCEVWLYHDAGIDIGLKKGAVLIVEGEFDCMSAWQSGIKNVVSPASGKDSYGVWLELLEPIAKIFIAYDNDKAGKEAGYKLAERVGVEKTMEVLYPEGIKDANDFFKKYSKDDFRALIKEARPFYTRKYNDLFDVINLLREDTSDKIEMDILPDVKIKPDQVVCIGAGTNVGKTSYALNIAKRLVESDIPTLILPFEGGIQTVGERFLRMLIDKTEEQFKKIDAEEWQKIIKKIVKTPVYFSMPKQEEIEEVIVKAKNILGVRAVILDHLDHFVRGAKDKEETAIRETMHKVQMLAINHGIMMFIISHTRRIHQAGAEIHKKPTLHDLRGSTAIEQYSQTVVMLDKVNDTTIEVDVQKNKGRMSRKTFNVDYSTGIIGDEVSIATSLDDF